MFGEILAIGLPDTCILCRRPLGEPWSSAGSEWEDEEVAGVQVSGSGTLWRERASWFRNPPK